MSRKLKINYQDFINENLNIQETLYSIIEALPSNPITSLLLYLAENEESYSDDLSINFISLNDSLNMIKYPSVKNRNNIVSLNYLVRTQVEMRIGRCIKSIISLVNKKEFSLEYIGSAIFNRGVISFRESVNGIEFSNIYNSNILYNNLENVKTYVKVFKDDNQVIGSNINSIRDQTNIIGRYNDRDYLTIGLDDIFELNGNHDVRINFEVKFDGKTIEDINDSDIENFVNMMIAFIKVNKASKDSIIEEVEGDDIKKWYDNSNYQSKVGQLGNSCMSYSHCQSYLDFYVKNPSCVSLLILKNKEDKLIGRALLWNINKEINGSKKFMDRIYCHTDYDVKIFEKFAVDNNYIYRNVVSGVINYIIGDIVIDKARIDVSLDRVDFKNYPYLDTLCFLNTTTSILSNSESDYNMELRDTDGYWLEYYEDNESDEYYDDY